MAAPGSDIRAAVPLVEPRVGLLASAVEISLPATRWGKGVAWLPELQPEGSVGYGTRALMCAVPDKIHSATDKAIVEQAYPFEVYAFDWCSTLEQRDWEGRARRLLLATQSYSIAQEFWDGALAIANATANTYLGQSTAPSTVVTTAAMTPQKALARLDNAVMVAMKNGRGMIHCTPETLDRLHDSHSLFRDGNQWTTANGTLVVADAGYSGNRAGQAANTEWMVGTTMVQIALGPVDVPDLSTDDGLRQAVVSSVNTMKVWARRAALVMHEPNICLKAAQVDLS